MRQRARERVVRERLRYGDSPPGVGARFAVGEPQQLVLDIGIDAVDDAVAVQIARSTAVPDLQLRTLAELQAGRLERQADGRGVDVDGEVYGVADRKRALSGNAGRIG